MLPKVYQTVLPQDFTLTPCRVYKKFIVQRSQFYSGSLPQTGSGYKLLEARYPTGKLKLGTDSQNTYETNSFDGSYKSLIWSSIDAQFYRNPYDPYKTFEHSNKRFTYKFLGVSASIISIPYLDYGESIKPGSVEITASGFYINDDGNGNLYDSSISTGSFSDSYNLVAYWTFNNQFRKFKELKHLSHDDVLPNNAGNDCVINGSVIFESKTFTPDVPSFTKNVRLSNGIELNTTASGFCGFFDNSSYMLTKDRPDFNFASNEDFTIAFWMKNAQDEQFNVIYPYNTILSKKGTVWKEQYGNQPWINSNGLLVQNNYTSASYVDEDTNVFPYDFRIYNDTATGLPTPRIIEFRRSDGINTCTLSASYLTNFNHVAVTKSGSIVSLFVNGNLAQSKTDNTNHPINDHCLMFGSDNQNFKTSYTGYLGEVRIYNKALTNNNITTLSDNTGMSAYQTAVIGNVFYKSGNIVISGHDTKYNDAMSSDWTLKFRSTHMIYSYECLVRIPAGSFNLSQNPTTLVNPNSDLIIDEMTGSLAEGALFPYATAIGLYNEKRELVAVAKLSQPLQMRDDVNLNISVKWDS